MTFDSKTTIIDADGLFAELSSVGQNDINDNI